MKLGETTTLRFGEGREGRSEHFGPGEADPPGAAIFLARLRPAPPFADPCRPRDGRRRSMARTHLELDSRQGPLPILAREGPGIRGTS